ncbi:MAG: glycosyltransferase, partial [Thermodesulfobacteriota bacterium]|nr:glycosyltransferase [Thermodesulfobacteriota bacterium]
MAPKRILVLNYEYPPTGGGAGEVTRNLCRFFVKKGLKIIVLTGWMPGLDYIKRESELTVIRVPMLKLKKHRTSFLGMASYLFSAFFPMFFLILFKRVDLIHAHFALPVGFLPFLGKRLLGKPYVVTLHGGDVPGMVPEQTDRLFRWFKWAGLSVVKNADAVTAVSSGLRDLAKESYPVPIEVIPNGIDSSWILQRSEPIKNDSDEIRLVFVGRLTHQKNVSGILEAVGLLNKSFKCRLDIIGDGPFLETLKDEARRFKSVHFQGWISTEGVKRYLDQSDIFLLPSFAEGLSIAALQAMGQGCALVVSNIPMNKDIGKESLSMGDLVQLAAWELVVGGLLAFGVFAAFAAFQFGGRVLDFQMGYGVANLIDPVTQAATPLIGTVLQLMAVITFYMLDGHHMIIRGLAFSLEQVPLGAPLQQLPMSAVVAQFGVMFSYGLAGATTAKP